MYSIKSRTASWSPPRVIRCASIAHRDLSPRARACLAAAILEGEATLKLTARQITAVLGANAVYVRAARRLKPEQRKAIADGEDHLTPFAAPSKPRKPALTAAPFRELWTRSHPQYADAAS